MKLGRLHWTLIGLVTAALVIFAPSDDVEVSKVARPGKQSVEHPASATTSMQQRAVTVGRVELERLGGRVPQQAEKNDVGNAFNVTSWYVPPPAPRVVSKPVVLAPLPPPAPVAPPLPFNYLGRFGDTASRTIILTKGDRVYTVAVGDVIENTYRVEKLSPGLVHLMYLPMNLEQVLRTGEAL